MLPHRIAIIDYGAGNVRSVLNAVTYLKYYAEVVSNPNDLTGFTHLILPGVGSFRRAMLSFKELQLDKTLPQLVADGIPILGICLGMQLLASRGSEDGETLGLGLIQGDVDRFAFNTDDNGLKIPHVGFNTVKFTQNSRLFKDIKLDPDFYFTHSYRLLCHHDHDISGLACHGQNFVASIEKGCVAGTQFHPEKSQANGLLLLNNFFKYF